MTYTVIKTEIIDKLVLTQIAYLINDKQYIIDVYHSVFDLSEQKMKDKIQEVGISEEIAINAIEAAKELISTINL
jgi:hypothetical protein